jgi:hypothetical protein
MTEAVPTGVAARKKLCWASATVRNEGLRRSRRPRLSPSSSRVIREFETCDASWEFGIWEFEVEDSRRPLRAAPSLSGPQWCQNTLVVAIRFTSEERAADGFMILVGEGRVRSLRGEIYICQERALAALDAQAIPDERIPLPLKLDEVDAIGGALTTAL